MADALDDEELDAVAVPEEEADDDDVCVDENPRELEVVPVDVRELVAVAVDERVPEDVRVLDDEPVDERVPEDV